MGHAYMKYIRWNLDVSRLKKADDHFSSKRMQKIRQSLRRMDREGYTLDFEDLTDAALDEYVEVYNKFIGNMDGGKVYPVRENVKKHQGNGRTYGFLALRGPDKKLLGGLLFSRKKAAHSIAYRVFPHTLPVKLSTSVSYIGEYMLVEKALEDGKERIVHGRDRNAYGINAAIGLAAYKLHVGALPYISTASTNVECRLPDVMQEDVLVCLGNIPGERCTEMVLYTDLAEDDLAKRYPFLSHYDEVPIRVEKRTQA